LWKDGPRPSSINSPGLSILVSSRRGVNHFILAHIRNLPNSPPGNKPEA
jgi:hypothetical protein